MVPTTDLKERIFEEENQTLSFRQLKIVKIWLKFDLINISMA